SSSTGLTGKQAAARFEQQGPNEISTADGVHPFKIFLNQFRDFIVYILLFAVVFSALLQEWADTVIIAIILIANAVIGFFQEYSAEKSLESLKQMHALKSRVRRDGSEQEIEAKQLVPGDVILLQSGDRVPADARLLQTTRLAIEESTLTGESLAVEKDVDAVANDATLGDRICMVYSSTTVTRGRGEAVVTATGRDTEIGRIATLVSETESGMTPLQKKLDRFGKRLGQVIIAICLFVFAALFVRDYSSNGLSLEVMLTFALIAVSLAVAAVPTALPTVVTVALSLGVKRLLHRNALVRRLSSVETLGSCDVICTDKTGTLTANQMTVRKVWTPDGEAEISGTGYEPEGTVRMSSGQTGDRVFRAGLACNNAELDQSDGHTIIKGEPTEGALLVSARKAGVTFNGKRLDELPFDTVRKRMSVLVEEDGQRRLYAKGAADVLIEHCTHIWINGSKQPLTDEHRRNIQNQTHNHADQALRVLAFAMKDLEPEEEFKEAGLTFLGLQSMLDPPREEVPEAIRNARKAGIRVIMITGDHVDTARAIGKMIGITGETLTGREVERLSDAELEKALEHVSGADQSDSRVNANAEISTSTGAGSDNQSDSNSGADAATDDIGNKRGVTIFARVASEHKYRIIQALQRLGHTVAMTGDGVNDAPALHTADIGVAVGSGTDVAREASDFVLLNDSFANITGAIEEGRGIYENIQKSIMLLLSGNFGEVLIIFLAVILGLNLPLTAVMLLWINLITDGAPALAFSVDPYGQHIMRRRPIPQNSPILPVDSLALLGFLGLIGSSIALALFSRHGGDAQNDSALHHTAQTMVFNFVVLYEIFLVYIIRYEYRVSLRANAWMWAAVTFSFVLQGVIMYTPLSVYFEVQPLQPHHLLELAIGCALLPAAYFMWRVSRQAYYKFAGKELSM
ncbi:MAG: cation-translocating P-type ATPase, partial [Leptospiraceae bacterium]|nr:cation-translocating P-type ATPase [Leptospiraceae bacterium]